MPASWQGIVIGVSVAAPVGPMAILCLRRSMMFGRSVGLASGMGVASAHALYSALAIFGLHGLSTLLSERDAVVQAVTAAVVVGLGVRIACGAPSGDRAQLPQMTTGSPYASALGMNTPSRLWHQCPELDATTFRLEETVSTHLSDVRFEVRPRNETERAGHPVSSSRPADRGAGTSPDTRSSYCRRCHSRYALSDTTILSVHSTSSGIVTYFRCPFGHPDMHWESRR